MHTADRFQGRDKDVVVLSLVRSNDACAIGELLRDWRRINVAFTPRKDQAARRRQPRRPARLRRRRDVEPIRRPPHGAPRTGYMTSPRRPRVALLRRRRRLDRLGAGGAVAAAGTATQRWEARVAEEERPLRRPR